MGTRRIIGLILIGAFVLLLTFALDHGPNRRFAKYIVAPVPKSVRVVTFHSNDWLAMNPEPVCYLAFHASVEDLAKVVKQGGFQRVSTKDAVPVPSGPPGWVTADQMRPGGCVYARSHSPTKARSLLPIGRNRRWSEFLWIDRTGTNAYFLVWGV